MNTLKGVPLRALLHSTGRVHFEVLEPRLYVLFMLKASDAHSIFIHVRANQS